MTCVNQVTKHEEDPIRPALVSPRRGVTPSGAAVPGWEGTYDASLSRNMTRGLLCPNEEKTSSSRIRNNGPRLSIGDAVGSICRSPGDTACDCGRSPRHLTPRCDAPHNDGASSGRPQTLKHTRTSIRTTYTGFTARGRAVYRSAERIQPFEASREE